MLRKKTLDKVLCAVLLWEGKKEKKKVKGTDRGVFEGGSGGEKGTQKGEKERWLPVKKKSQDHLRHRG